jgi:hypothetical protein
LNDGVLEDILPSVALSFEITNLEDINFAYWVINETTTTEPTVKTMAIDDIFMFSQDNIPLWVALAVGLLVIIVIIVFIGFCCRRHRQKKKRQVNYKSYGTHPEEVNALQKNTRTAPIPERTTRSPRIRGGRRQNEHYASPLNQQRFSPDSQTPRSIDFNIEDFGSPMQGEADVGFDINASNENASTSPSPMHNDDVENPPTYLDFYHDNAKRLEAYFTRIAKPRLIKKIPKILVRNKGKEAKLFNLLVEKYGGTLTLSPRSPRNNAMIPSPQTGRF